MAGQNRKKKKKKKRIPKNRPQGSSSFKAKSSQGFHLMAKPAGPLCNLDCKYCFYVEKKAFFKDQESCRMSDKILEAYTKNYIRYQVGNEVVFSWQGGEPSLMGLDFYQKALDYQEKYRGNKLITNTFQTNGTLIDEKWCEFFRKNNFLVGLSIDGPESIHDKFRLDAGGKPTFDKVLKTLKMFREYGVEFNVLACVNRESSKKPLEVYEFFRENRVEYIQFIPIVERYPDKKADEMGLSLSTPPDFRQEDPSAEVTSWSLLPGQYGDFLITIFDQWIRKDVGKIFIMNFEWSLGAYAGLPVSACYFSERCGRALIIEHNGDVYSCDHYVYPDYRLGNILDNSLGGMLGSQKQQSFGKNKKTMLPDYCRDCNILHACRGECPKRRFAKTPDGKPGLNYLCKDYKKYFQHTEPYFRQMLELINSGKTADNIMRTL